MLPQVGPWKATFVIVLIALIVRGIGALYVQGIVDKNEGAVCLIPGDANGYWQLARNLVAGDDYAIYDPPRAVLRMPGFPALLAMGMLIVGEDPGRVRFFLAVIGSLVCGGVYLLGRDLFDEQSAWWGALATALSPTLSGMSVLILSETFFAGTLLFSIWAIDRWLRAFVLPASNSLLFASVLMGVAGALATYARPNWLLFCPIVILIAAAVKLGATGSASAGAIMRRRAGGVSPLILPTKTLAEPVPPERKPPAKSNEETGGLRPPLARAGWRRGFWSLALCLLGMCVTLAPWVIRNYAVTGHVVLTTLWMGPSLYDGVQPGATGESDMQFVEQDGLYHRLSEYDVDQYYRQAGWKLLRENPGRGIQLGMAKLWLYCSLYPDGNAIPKPLAMLIALATGVLYLLTIIGLFSIWNSDRRIQGLLCLGPFLYLGLIHSLFVGSIRYRVPAEYLLWLIAGAGFLRIKGCTWFPLTRTGSRLGLARTENVPPEAGGQ